MSFSSSEEAELRALVHQAGDYKNTPWYDDACAAIEAWYQRLPLTRYEHNQDAQSLYKLLYGLSDGIGHQWGFVASWRLLAAVAAFLDGNPQPLGYIAERLERWNTEKVPA